MASSAVIGSLRVNLSANAADFVNGLMKADDTFQKVGKRLQRMGAGFSAAITAPVIGIGAVVLRTAGDFEASMNRVGAALSAPADQMDALRDRAKELGRTTSFTASQSADAIEILAKNGLNAAQILGGALEASLTLAASSSAQLGDAADLATDVMLNFGKGAGELGEVADGVTGVLLASKFGFDDYRLALAQAGGAAGGLGVSLSDFNAVIAATSASFASGSDAGTSFKTFLQRLVPASSTARNAMEALKLQFFESDGSMKSMAAIAQELQTALSGLSDEERIDALSDIFGQDAMRTAISLAREGAEGIERLHQAIGEASAVEQADARMQGFNGAMKKLASAFEGLQLAIADSGLLEFATDLVESLTGLVAKVSEADPRLVKFGVTFAALGAAVGPALIAIGAAIAILGGPITIAVAGIAALTAGVIAFGPEIMELAATIRNEAVAALGRLSDLVEELVALVRNSVADMVQAGRDLVAGLWRGIEERIEGVRAGVADFAGGLVDAVKDQLGIQSPSRVFQEIGRFMMEGLGLGIAEGAQKVSATTEEMVSGVSQEITGPFKAALSRGEGAFDGFANAVVGIGERMRDRLIDRAFAPIEAALDKLLTGASSAGGGLFSALASAAVAGIAGSVGGISLGGGAGITPSGTFVDFSAGGGFASLPMYSGGTNFHPGGLAVVGDGGEPEVVDLPRGSRVTPISQIGRGGHQIDARTYIDARGADAAQIAALRADMDRRDAALPKRIAAAIGQPEGPVDRALSGSGRPRQKGGGLG